MFSGAYMDTEFSATYGRVLVELYIHDGYTAAGISKIIGLDRSHVSKIVRDHVKEGFITRSKSPADDRIYELHLTEKGVARTEEYMMLSENAVTERIETLSEIDRKRLIEAFDTINDILKY